MATDAEILALAVPRIEADEGVRTAAYLDTRGIPTIGFGHTGREVHLGLVWTMDQVSAQLSADVALVLKGLDTALSWWRKLDAVRAEVLVNIAFNVGVHGLMGFRHMLAAVQLEDWKQAAAEIVNSEIAPLRAQRLAKLMIAGPVTGPIVYDV